MMQEQVNRLIGHMREQFKERGDVIWGLWVAAVARLPLLMVGPSGSAKSALAEYMSRALSGGRFFKRALRQDTAPSELIGSVDYRAFKEEGVVRYMVGGWGSILEHRVIFLDEITRCNSPVVSLLLPILEEREFVDAAGRHPARWDLFVAAANWLPRDEEAQALLDRFVLRYQVGWISDPGAFVEMLQGEIVMPTAEDEVDITPFQEAADRVAIPDHILAKLARIRARCRSEGLATQTSDRRWKKAVRALKASAALRGAPEVGDEDIVSVLPYILWNDPRELPKIKELVGEEVDFGRGRVENLVARAREIIGQWSSRAGSRVTGEQARQQAANDLSRLRSILNQARQAVEADPGAKSDPRVAQALRALEAMVMYMKDVTMAITTEEPVPPFK